jgi:putative redox protein
MVPITVTYQGDLRCEAEHGPSRQRLTTDAPKDNQGKGEAFSPTDLVATALGACMTTIMGIVARRDGLKIDGLRVAVEKHMTAAPPRRIARIVLRFSMPAGIPVERRRPLEAAARACPVGLSLHPEVQVEDVFVYPA